MKYIVHRIPEVYLDMFDCIIDELKTPLSRVLETEEVEFGCNLVKYSAQTFIKSGYIVIDLEYTHSGIRITLDEFSDLINTWRNIGEVTIHNKVEQVISPDPSIGYSQPVINEVIEFSGELFFGPDDNPLRYKITLGG